ncbi:MULTISPECIES: DNA polymerase III subunit gamma and tau [Actinotignum]|uniref:DNA polymerase III subunit gamma and tau n=1 Tax=Actinotignum TaxID=1653174 RepID=UPI00254EB6AD|nr:MULTISPECIES: DNA polymerase III subunit gamma and tau [Actinotignum]MDK7272294.1 DNA polymerase III subunit gamma and tau [Actinotignum schaalii]MDY5135258.1 DNA polymerase III subunit gamma and tau [Actinotignum timonense]
MALYRRYRPERFQDVIGQEQVTRPLMAALRGERTVHAYLFSGPRGCGKTTSARILARCLNCAQAPTDTPCGECASCRELAGDGPGSLDVVEMDAASHGGVDDARDLVERAAFAPSRDRYKIFIIDEAHMVTTQGFNALLKLVEEPPAHIKFIFATTEPEKVIGTIRSRTHHYPFRLVSPARMEEYLSQICAEEGITPEPGVLGLVVRAGGGSVRDSLSVLDQLMGGSETSTLSYSQAVALLGYTDSGLLDRAVTAIAESSGSQLFGVVEELIGAGHEPRRFVEDLLQRLRDLIVIDLAGDAAADALGELPQDQLAAMRTQAQALGAARATESAERANEALSAMVGATSPRLQLELLCARLLLPGSAAAPSGSGSGGAARPVTGPAASGGTARKSPQDIAREKARAAAAAAAAQRGAPVVPGSASVPSASAPQSVTSVSVQNDDAATPAQSAPQQAKESPAAPAAAQPVEQPAQQRAPQPEERPAQQAVQPAGEPAAVQQPREVSVEQPAAPEESGPDHAAELTARWAEVTSSGRFAQAIFSGPTRVLGSRGNQVALEFSSEKVLGALQDPRNVERLSAHLSHFTSVPVTVRVIAAAAQQTDAAGQPGNAGQPANAAVVENPQSSAAAQPRPSGPDGGGARPKANAATAAAAPAPVPSSPAGAPASPAGAPARQETARGAGSTAADDEWPEPEELSDPDDAEDYPHSRQATAPGNASSGAVSASAANPGSANSGSAHPGGEIPFYLQNMPMPQPFAGPGDVPVSPGSPAPGASQPGAGQAAAGQPGAPEPTQDFHIPRPPQRTQEVPTYDAREHLRQLRHGAAGGNAPAGSAPGGRVVAGAGSTANAPTAPASSAPAGPNSSHNAAPQAGVGYSTEEDDVSLDDPTIEQSNVVGLQVVVEMLSGTIVEEIDTAQGGM